MTLFLENESWGDNKMARAALLAVEDKALCQEIAAFVSNIFMANRIDEELAEYQALPLLVEMAHLVNEYVATEVL
jgi:hypothetical protein